MLEQHGHQEPTSSYMISLLRGRASEHGTPVWLRYSARNPVCLRRCYAPMQKRRTYVATNDTVAVDCRIDVVSPDHAIGRPFLLLDIASDLIDLFVISSSSRRLPVTPHLNLACGACDTMNHYVSSCDLDNIMA